MSNVVRVAADLVSMRRLPLAALFVGLTLLTGSARADDVAPGLAHEDLRDAARNELVLLGPPLGTYIAFDATRDDPSVTAACDDDGDPVVVVSDAFLDLAAAIAMASVFDEARPKAEKLENYARFVARSQVRGKRLLPPPPGFYETAAPPSERRLREILAFAIARELAIHVSGALRCSHPTATREAGDDEWTRAERAADENGATRLYPAADHDRDVIERVLDVDRGEAGALALLAFFARVEEEPAALRFVSRYERLHPHAAARRASVEKAARMHPKTKAGLGPPSQKAYVRRP